MNTTIDLFDNDTVPPPLRLADGALLLRGFADPVAAGLLADIGRVAAAAPLRRMTTPGGRAMSVEMSNCGAVGWVSDASGYRYDPLDPLSRRRWPAMPDRFAQLATMAAAAAGFAGFEADACLINRYAVGARLSLHQDRDELDYSQPIVSVSLGLPANFVFGGREARRPDAAGCAAPRRCRRLGWRGPPAPSWRADPEGRRASADRQLPLQPDIAPRTLNGRRAKQIEPGGIDWLEPGRAAAGMGSAVAFDSIRATEKGPR